MQQKKFKLILLISFLVFYFYKRFRNKSKNERNEKSNFYIKLLNATKLVRDYVFRMYTSVT